MCLPFPSLSLRDTSDEADLESPMQLSSFLEPHRCRFELAAFFFFLMLMYKLQSTEDSSTWLVVRIRSAENGHSSIQQGAGKQHVQIKTY